MRWFSRKTFQLSTHKPRNVINTFENPCFVDLLVFLSQGKLMQKSSSIPPLGSHPRVGDSPGSNPWGCMARCLPFLLESGTRGISLPCRGTWSKALQHLVVPSIFGVTTLEIPVNNKPGSTDCCLPRKKQLYTYWVCLKMRDLPPT